MLTELWVDKTDFRRTRVVQGALPELAPGQILVAIEKFALTANNVTYAASGDLFGYWHFYPTGEDPWGRVTVWGIGEVVESASEDIPVGERLYGFFPMSSHVLMQPGSVSRSGFSDLAPHRQPLPGLYNRYARTEAEPTALQAIESERCIFFPLFMTGFVIADLLSDQSWFGAEQVVIGSGSSKTGFSTAAFVKAAGMPGKVVGLTGARTAEFSASLGCYDQVLGYEAVEALDKLPTVYVDIAGNLDTRSRLHHHLQDQAVQTLLVGATHWDQFSASVAGGALPGAEPTLFFAPSQIEKRDAEWGPGAIVEKAQRGSLDLLQRIAPAVHLETHHGVEACRSLWLDALENRLSGQRGVIISL